MEQTPRERVDQEWWTQHQERTLRGETFWIEERPHRTFDFKGLSEVDILLMFEGLSNHVAELRAELNNVSLDLMTPQDGKLLVEDGMFYSDAIRRMLGMMFVIQEQMT